MIASHKFDQILKITIYIYITIINKTSSIKREQMRKNKFQLQLFDPKNSEQIVEKYLNEMKKNFVIYWSSIHQQNCDNLNGYCHKISI